MPATTSAGRAQAAGNALAGGVSIPTGGRVGLPGAPEHTGLGEAPGRGQIDPLIGQAAGGVNLSPAGRAALGEAPGENRMEQLALEGFEGGFDPGTGQFVGSELDDEIFSEAQIGQLAQQRAAPTIRAFKDAERYAAAAGSRGGYVDPGRISALRARGAIEGAGALSGATRDAQLEGAVLNAEQAARAAANKRENFGADLAARLGLGRLGLEGATSAGRLGLERRGMDQERDIAGYRGEITQRGQDIEQGLGEAGINARLLDTATGAALGARGQDIGYATESGRQNLAARGQELDYNVAGGRLGVDQRGQDIGAATEAARLGTTRDLARASHERGLYDTQVGENLGLGRLAADVRGQDISAAATGRSQDINQMLGLGRLGLSGYQTQAQLFNAQQERQSQLEGLERRLQSSRLTSQERNELERERMDLQWELERLRQQQRESEFGRSFGLGERELGERGRQFDEGLIFQGEQGVLGRDLVRQQSANLRDFQREQQLMDWLESYSDPQAFARMLESGLRDSLPQLLQQYGMN